MLLTNAKIAAFFLGLETKFNAVYKDTPTLFDKIATEVPSETETELQAWMSRLPGLREWIGERQMNDVAARVQQLTNKLFEDSFKVKRTKLEDDKKGIYQPLVSEMARQAKQWPDKQVFDALKAGGTAVVYDNQHFFDTAHPINMDDPNSATQSNLYTGKPLSADNLAAVVAGMATMKGEDGVELEVQADTLVVGPSDAHLARKILQAETIAVPVGTSGTSPGGAAGETNVLKGSMNLVVAPKLSGAPGTYYVLDTSRAIKPLVFQMRQAPEFTYKNRPDDELAFKQDEFAFGVRARGVAGYGPWFLAAKATP